MAKSFSGHNVTDCPNCERTIDITAVKCPYCKYTITTSSHNLTSKERWLTIIAPLFLLFWIIVLICVKLFMRNSSPSSYGF